MPVAMLALQNFFTAFVNVSFCKHSFENQLHRGTEWVNHTEFNPSSAIP